jgi:endonuclease/exonuclease/phosphatase family metal-dependent hydrolase
MRIASFNVENMFRRAVAMNGDTWAEGKSILTEVASLNVRLQKDVYTAADKTAILASLGRLGLLEKDENKFVILRQNHGHLLKRPRSGPTEVVADGRSDWIGWLELKTEAVNEIATQMTAKVIHEVQADILVVVEAEDRIALTRFDEQLLQPIAATYDNIMLIDGNDDRGIDVGLMMRTPFRLLSMVSHVDDRAADDSRIFSRDCPEYTIETDSGERILILANHFKSKGFGTKAVSDARRRAQAARVREIYDERRAEGIKLIAVAGDFNDTPDSDPLKPLLGDGSSLKDIVLHPKFVSDGRPGTFANGTASNKIDYLLLSPQLFARVTAGGIFRKGVWGGVNGTLFPHFDEMTAALHAASDHAAIWADIS